MRLLSIIMLFFANITLHAQPYEQPVLSCRLKLTVLHGQTRQTVPFAYIALKDILKGSTQALLTDSAGMINLMLPRFRVYEVFSYKDEYFSSKTQIIRTDSLEESLQLENISFYDGLNKTPLVIHFNPRAFSFSDGSATTILDSLANVIDHNENLVIEIRGHSGITGKADDDFTLSIKRAEKVKNYLLDRIQHQRVCLVASGYGSFMPIKDCTRQKCTSREKLLNDRVEIRLVKHLH